MASKSRGGLSKRELAASQKMKLTKKVSTPRSTASKASSSTPVGAIGQNKDGSFIYDKSTPNYTPANANYSSIGGYSGQSSPTGKIVTPKKTSSSSKSSSSSSSSKSNKSKVSGLVRSDLGVNTASASSEPNFTPAPTADRSLAAAFAGKGVAPGAFSSTPPIFNENGAIGEENTNETFIGKGLRMLNEAPRLFGGESRLVNKDFGVSEFLRLNGVLRSPQETVNNLLGVSTANASSYDGLGGAQENTNAPVSHISDQLSSNVGQPFEQSQNNQESYSQEIARTNPPKPQAQSFNTTGGSGSSLGVTGGATADPSTDSYIKDLQKSTEGDFGAKDATKQIKDLIRSLDPEYDAYLKQAQSELDKSKTEDLNKLAGVFAGYNTADSEQRLQQQERVQGDYATQLTNLLAKLQLQKQKDVTGYKSQLSERLQNIAQAKSTAQQRVAELIQAAQDKAWDRNYKMKALSQRGRAGSDANSYIDGAKELQIQLSNLRGEDGFIDPQDYLDAQTAFLTDYPQSASKFSSIFPVENYLSPIERISKGLQ